MNKEDVNRQDNIYAQAIRGVLLYLNDNIKLRGERVAHRIYTTGDDTMRREALYRGGRDWLEACWAIPGSSPLADKIPRCGVAVSGFKCEASSSSQRAMGVTQLGDELVSGMFKRYEVGFTIELTYVLDSFTQCLELMQELVSQLAWERQITIAYNGADVPVNIAYDGGGAPEYETDFGPDADRSHKVTASIDITTELPVFESAAIFPASAVITKTANNAKIYGDTVETRDQEASY